MYEQESFMIININRVNNAVGQLEAERRERLECEEYDRIMRELGVSVLK